MQIYKVRDPSGAIREISGPEGATDDQVIAQAQKLFASQPKVSAAALIANDPITKGAERAASVDPFELAVGSAPGRFVQGMASPFVGAAQLGMNALGRGEDINALIAGFSKATQKGREALDSEGMDWAGLTGTAVSPASFAMLKAVPVAATLWPKILQGMGIGAGYGAATPVTNGGENFWSDKAYQTGTGTAVGGIIPAAAGLAKGGYNSLRGLLDAVVLPGGPQRITDKYIERIVGKDNLPSVVSAARNAQELVTGSKPTMAEAVAGLAEGSPIQAHQRTVAQTSGGISSEFGARKLEQEAARIAAEAERSAVTTPMRESALLNANAGGVKSSGIDAAIDTLLAKPGLRASDVVQKTLGTIKDKIKTFTSENGTINADDLYMIRKEIGNVIRTHSKETANFDKRLSGGLQRDIQQAIDDAIESAGGTGWKAYLAEFAARSKGIDADIARAKLAAKPVQRTDLQGGINVAEESRPHIPNLLSRPAMIANWAMKLVAGKGSGVENKVDQILAQRYLNPENFAAALQAAPISQRRQMITDFMQRYGRGATIGAPANALADMVNQ